MVLVYRKNIFPIGLVLYVPVLYLSKIGVLILLFSASVLHAETSGSITIFGQVAESKAVGNSVLTPLDEQSFLSGDILGSLSYNRFQVLAEYFMEGSDGDIERLQLGYELNDSTRIWLGKFHNPAEYWLHEYHQGYYLQPSITTPFDSFAGYQGGLTAKNLSGVRLDTEFMLTEEAHQVKAFFTVADTTNLSAVAPDVDVDDFFTRDSSDQLLLGVKLAYKPDPLGESSFGISYTEGVTGTDDDEIAAVPFLGSLLVGTELDLSHTSLYVNLENDFGRLLYSHSNMTLNLIAPETATEMLVGILGDTNFNQEIDFRYLHGEVYFNDKWSVFARYEEVKTTDPSQLVAQFLESINLEANYEKKLIGLRFDPIAEHAISLQYTDHTTRRGKENNLHLNWTFVCDWGF